MSIEEDSKEIKPLGANSAPEGGKIARNIETFPTEEEFDIVPKREGNQNKSPISRDTGLIVFIIVLIALLAYGIGKLSTLEANKGNVEILYPETSFSSSTQQSQSLGQVRGASITNVPTNTEVVASKSGTKYHFPWCSGAKRISSANKISFSSPKEARAAGYTPALNCKGLE